MGWYKTFWLGGFTTVVVVVVVSREELNSNVLPWAEAIA